MKFGWVYEFLDFYLLPHLCVPSTHDDGYTTVPIFHFFYISVTVPGGGGVYVCLVVHGSLK